MRTIALPAPGPCDCIPEHTRLGAHYVGDRAVESAILDLTRFTASDEVAASAARAHEKSIGYPLRRARREGYTVREFGGTFRNPEIEAVNTSKTVRQGRAMAADYGRKLVATPGDNDAPRPRKCAQHYRTMYGTFSKDDVLVAYISFIRSGPLGILSRILAHADFWRDGTMHACVGHTLTAAHADGVDYVLYGAWGDGQGGLKDFKRRWGFEPMRMTMEPVTTGGTR